MTESISINQLIANFWEAPEDAKFDQKTIAPVTSYSPSWFERKRWEGGGIPYQKIGRKCLYTKRDVVNWLNQHSQVTSTSEYAA